MNAVVQNLQEKISVSVSSKETLSIVSSLSSKFADFTTYARFVTCRRFFVFCQFSATACKSSSVSCAGLLIEVLGTPSNLLHCLILI